MKKWCRTFLLSCLLCLSLCTLAQATDGEPLRVGLKYGSDAMSAANLQNYSAFGGYALGYFDADGSFEELGALPQLYEKITVTTDTTYHCSFPARFTITTTRRAQRRSTAAASLPTRMARSMRALAATRA